MAISPRAKLGAVMGSAAAATALLGTVALWEGKRNVGYLDIARIPTACYGDTKNVQVGKFYTDAECTSRLEQQALVHVEGVLRCTPTLRGRPAQLHAAGSLAYNIGVTAYCRSTAARLFNAGRWREGCNAMTAWHKARVNGVLQPVRGLQNRRAYELKICVAGLPA